MIDPQSHLDVLLFKASSSPVHKAVVEDLIRCIKDNRAYESLLSTTGNQVERMPDTADLKACNMVIVGASLREPRGTYSVPMIWGDHKQAERTLSEMRTIA